LVAAHDGPVGVDLERLDQVNRAFCESIATPQERAALESGDAGTDLTAWAIDLWSSKEALAKALGDAVAYAPGRLQAPAGWPQLRAGAWRAERLTVPAGHVGWLCWRAAETGM
jgi:phosphopantetheinyl transferase